ncbi:hypothetical protein JTB14_007377 [Gonioctena quinquepunctata]|nr:hypothetical protein JTB14_007377 [Gonioctena quinquepunctata]
MCMSPNDGAQEANEENDEILQQLENNSEFEDFPRNDEMLQQIENENQRDQPYRLRNRNLIKRSERFGEFDTGLSGQGDPVTFKGAVEGENGNSW